MPRLDAMPQGCAFHPRCPLAAEPCRQAVPALRASSGSQAACIRLEAAA
jgi:peptide/nickel transport system ATP-binding protein